MTPAARRLVARAVEVQRSTAGPVPSPCTGVCRIDPASGWCGGCWRTLDEITAWGGLDDSGRRSVWQRLAQRVTASREAA